MYYIYCVYIIYIRISACLSVYLKLTLETVFCSFAATSDSSPCGAKCHPYLYALNMNANANTNPKRPKTEPDGRQWRQTTAQWPVWKFRRSRLRTAVAVSECAWRIRTHTYKQIHLYTIYRYIFGYIYIYTYIYIYVYVLTCACALMRGIHCWFVTLPVSSFNIIWLIIFLH